MKIVVKSTKTISFDEHSEEDDSSDHNDESDGISKQEQEQKAQEPERKQSSETELVPISGAPEHADNTSAPTSNTST